MTLRGGLAALAGLVLAGCYGVPLIGGHDGGDGAAGASDAAGTGGSGGTAGNDRGGQSGSSGGGAGSVSRGGTSGGGSGGAGVGGVGGTAGGGAGGTAAGGASGGGGGAGGAAGATACNPACDGTHTCTGGHCLLADAQQCLSASQCASGACNPFYADVDGDGYGTGQAVGFCTLTSAPIGYAAQNGDCCDDAANIAVAKLIHPGADFQTTSAGGICNGITWDYDCSGKVSSDWQHCGSCTAVPECGCVYMDWAESNCGRITSQNPCVLQVSPAGMYCFQTSAGEGPVRCR